MPEARRPGAGRGFAGHGSAGHGSAGGRGSAGRRRARARRGTGTLAWMGIGGRALAAGLSLLILLGSGYAWASYRGFQSNVTHVDAITPATSGQPARTDIDIAAQNILLVGDDHRPANASPQLLQQLSTTQDGGAVNTDTMMVMHIPANGAKATVISFPRDSWVDIPGFGKNKLNAAFEFGTQNGGGDTGGARLLIQVIQNMTGLTIDHFVRVSMVGFYQIAQVLGPIKVCLNEHAVEPDSGIDLPAGVSYLNPKQALSFVRQRHGLPRGDLDREVRQQYFLASALSQIASAGTLLNPFKLQSLLGAVSSALETDPGLNLLSFAQQFSSLAGGNVTYATIPTTGTPTISVNGSDVSIVAVDFTAIPAFITAIIGQPSAYTAAAPAAPGDVTVQVVNGSGNTGLGTTNTTALAGLGFHTLPAQSTDTTSITTIEYPAGGQAQAKALAAHVPGATAVLDSNVSALTLLLGSDGHQVAAETATSPIPSPSPSVPTAGSASTAPRAYNPNECIN